MSEPTGIETDLAQTLARIKALTAPEPARLAEVAALLEGFVARHRAELSFEDFPLPSRDDDALCAYELHRDRQTGLTLNLNAIRGGVDSVVHDHGTWAVIAAIAGSELNRIYRPAEAGGLVPEREATVRPGRPLVLEQGAFHSIHTEQPTLQLHLYGQPIDTIGGRRIYDPRTGELLPLD
jgi:predicted metal-dependent enzyme (double-stranded beta helix superfamily)